MCVLLLFCFFFLAISTTNFQRTCLCQNLQVLFVLSGRVLHYLWFLFSFAWATDIFYRTHNLFAVCFVAVLFVFLTISTTNLQRACLCQNLQVLFFSFGRVFSCFWFVLAIDQTYCMLYLNHGLFPVWSVDPLNFLPRFLMIISCCYVCAQLASD